MVGIGESEEWYVCYFAGERWRSGAEGKKGSELELEIEYREGNRIV